MKYLNLTTGYNPNNARDEDLIKFEAFTFSGGEPHIKLQPEKFVFKDVIITHRIESFNDLGLLMVAVDALKGMLIQYPYRTSLQLHLPYFPGARQDRRMIHGEPLTVKIYADIINSLGFDNITILDPHSDVTTALLNNVTVINNHDFVHQCIVDIWKESPFDTAKLISPDAGSNKKSLKLIQSLSPSYDLIKCDKTRDIRTGEITNFDVYADDLNQKACFIVDDICSNGGTFLGLANELIKKNAGDLYLIVTHGEFGNDRLKTLANLQTKFKKVYYSDSFSKVEDDTGFSNQLKVIM